jgi:5-(carboxyamino)imidazole ribonucleotide mutase
MAPLVSILVGSKTDWEHMAPASEVLTELGIPFEAKVLSAHRAPDLLFEYIAEAGKVGVEVFIAGAGGAAHLPGMIAAKTLTPVLGVPMPTTTLGGLDALLAIVQMPKGTPVATMAIGKAGAGNAALFAAQLLAAKRPELKDKLRAWKEARKAEMLKQTLP